MATLIAYDEAGVVIYGIEDEDENEVACYVIVEEDD